MLLKFDMELGLAYLMCAIFNAYRFVTNFFMIFVDADQADLQIKSIRRLKWKQL